MSEPGMSGFVYRGKYGLGRIVRPELRGEPYISLADEGGERMLRFSHPAPALIEADEFTDFFHDLSLAFCREFFTCQEVLCAIGPAISHQRQHSFLYVVEEDIIFGLGPAGLMVVQHAVI